MPEDISHSARKESHSEIFSLLISISRRSSSLLRSRCFPLKSISSLISDGEIIFPFPLRTISRRSFFEAKNTASNRPEEAIFPPKGGAQASSIIRARETGSVDFSNKPLHASNTARHTSFSGKGLMSPSFRKTPQLLFRTSIALFLSRTGFLITSS